MAQFVDKKGNLIGDLKFQASIGAIPGVQPLRKFGQNADIDSGVKEDVWDGGGIWAEPTQARIHQIKGAAGDVGTLISSGSITGNSNDILIDENATFISDGVAVGDIVLNDTHHAFGFVSAIVSEEQITVSLTRDLLVPDSHIGDVYRIARAGSTGAGVILIHNGLDSDYLESSEFIILNGATDIPTITEYTNINFMSVLCAGATGANEGIILATADTDATVTAQINIGNNQTLMAIYQVPANKILLMSGGTASNNRASTSGSSDFELLLKPFGGVYRLADLTGLQVAGTSRMTQHFDPYLLLPPKSIIKVSCTASANNFNVSASFSGYRVKFPFTGI